MTRSLFYEIRAHTCFESWLILYCVFRLLFYYFNYSRVFSSIVVCNYLCEKLIWAFSTHINSLCISGINSFKLFIYKLLSRTTFSFRKERLVSSPTGGWGLQLHLLFQTVTRSAAFHLALNKYSEETNAWRDRVPYKHGGQHFKDQSNV